MSQNYNTVYNTVTIIHKSKIKNKIYVYKNKTCPRLFARRANKQQHIKNFKEHIY